MAETATFTYQSLSLPCYAVGADLVESPAGSFLIACAEKALADKVWTDKRFPGARRSDFPSYLEEDLRIGSTCDRSVCGRGTQHRREIPAATQTLWPAE